MYCKACGNGIPDDSTFCMHCGVRLSEAEAPVTREYEPPLYVKSAKESGVTPLSKLVADKHKQSEYLYYRTWDDAVIDPTKTNNGASYFVDRTFTYFGKYTPTFARVGFICEDGRLLEYPRMLATHRNDAYVKDMILFYPDSL